MNIFFQNKYQLPTKESLSYLAQLSTLLLYLYESCYVWEFLYFRGKTTNNTFSYFKLIMITS